jgi:hypothetical protein
MKTKNKTKTKTKTKTKNISKCISKPFKSSDDIPIQFKDDKEIVIKSLLTARKDWVITNISKRLKKDPDVIKALKYKQHDERIWLSDKLNFTLKNKIVNRNDMIDLIKKISVFKKKRGTLGYEFKDSILLNASTALKDDKDIVISCVKIVPESYKDASPRLQQDDNVIRALVTILHFYEFKEIKEIIPNLNKDIALKLVTYNPRVYSKLVDYQTDKDIIIEALKDPAYIRYYVVLHIPNNMKKDKDIEKALDIKDPRYFSEKYNNDEKLILKAIKYDRTAIQYASNKLKNDKTFLIKYMKKSQNYKNIMNFLSKKLQKDRDLYLLDFNDRMLYYKKHKKTVKNVLGSVDSEYQI